MCFDRGPWTRTRGFRSGSGRNRADMSARRSNVPCKSRLRAWRRRKKWYVFHCKHGRRPLFLSPSPQNECSIGGRAVSDARNEPTHSLCLSPSRAHIPEHLLVWACGVRPRPLHGANPPWIDFGEDCGFLIP